MPRRSFTFDGRVKKVQEFCYFIAGEESEFKIKPKTTELFIDIK